MSEAQKQENPMVFLLKTTKKKYVDDMMKQGRFCFNHPSVFNIWDEKDAAQYDCWDGYSAHEAIYFAWAPIIGYKDGMPIYGQGKASDTKGIVRMQTGEVKNTPICCFRMVNRDEVEYVTDEIHYSLGKTAEKIKNEFKHDAYIFIQAAPFLKRIKKVKNIRIAMPVVYQDLLNDYQFNVRDEYKEIAEQLFRKDKKYEWQKEYRIVLKPTKEERTFIELGSIEDIAVCGDIEDLMN